MISNAHSCVVDDDDRAVIEGFHVQIWPVLMNNLKRNILLRIDNLLQTIKKKKALSEFCIPLNLVENAMAKMLPQIKEHTKVDIDKCKSKPNTLMSYKTLARNRLNRNKAQLLANCVFNPIVFGCLIKFCISRLGSINGMFVFVDTLVQLLNCAICFYQTKALPLIPLNALAKNNQFQSNCLQLLAHYRISEYEWLSNSSNVKFETSIKVYRQYLSGLSKIKNVCHLTNVPQKYAVVANNGHINRAKCTAQVNPIICGHAHAAYIDNGNISKDINDNGNTATGIHQMQMNRRNNNNNSMVMSVGCYDDLYNKNIVKFHLLIHQIKEQERELQRLQRDIEVTDNNNNNVCGNYY